MEKKKPERKQTGIRLPADLLKRLKYLSIDTDRSVNDLIIEAVENLLKKYQKGKK